MDQYQDHLTEQAISRFSSDPFNETYQNVLYEKFLAAITALPEIFQSAVTLREIDDLKYSDIAKMMNMSEGTVRSRLLRARRRLQELLHLEVTESFA